MDVREKLVEIVERASVRTLPKNTCHTNIVMLVNALIEEGVTVQEWIPVGDSPKERGVYIVTVKHWLDGKPVTREAKWNGADWLSCYKAEEITPRVTHWLPLPKPPKGE